MNFSPYLMFNGNCKEAFEFYARVLGGDITMPLAETFWAERFAMFTDHFGTPWMLNCDKANQ